MKPEPVHCAGHGGVCSCPNGNVFFGRKFEDDVGGRISNFETMMEDNFVVAKAKNGEVNCVAASFVGGDPLPGVAKDCYCDNKEIFPQESVDDQIEYQQGIVDEKKAAEAKAKADAEAKAAKEAADAELARLRDALADAEGKIAAADTAYQQAQVEAQKAMAELQAKNKAEAEARAAAEAKRLKEEEEAAKQKEKEH